jgi:hypothetical protein
MSILFPLWRPHQPVLVRLPFGFGAMEARSAQAWDGFTEAAAELIVYS